MYYVIAGPEDVLDGERLFWSNEDGWVDFDSATRFDDTNWILPVDAIGWIPVPEGDKQKEALDELQRISQELGLYE